MTNTMYDKPTIGDLIMDYGSDKMLGIITFIEPPVGTSQELYFVQWTSGGLTGYTTAHHLKDIERWSINVRLGT